MKNAIVTGATRGIGLAIARMLLQKGYFVIVTYGHDEQEAMKASCSLSEISSSFEIVRVDQTNKQEVKDFSSSMSSSSSACRIASAILGLRRTYTFLA